MTTDWQIISCHYESKRGHVLMILTLFCHTLQKSTQSRVNQIFIFFFVMTWNILIRQHDTIDDWQHIHHNKTFSWILKFFQDLKKWWMNIEYGIYILIKHRLIILSDNVIYDAIQLNYGLMYDLNIFRQLTQFIIYWVQCFSFKKFLGDFKGKCIKNDDVFL